jgi:hypothetical protein
VEVLVPLELTEVMVHRVNQEVVMEIILAVLALNQLRAVTAEQVELELSVV